MAQDVNISGRVLKIHKQKPATGAIPCGQLNSREFFSGWRSVVLQQPGFLSISLVVSMAAGAQQRLADAGLANSRLSTFLGLPRSLV